MTTRNRLLVIVLLLIVLFMVLTVPQLTGDLQWCIENASTDRIPHCMWYENTLWGQYIQPAGY